MSKKVQSLSTTILYPIPGRTWDGMCYPGFLRYLDRGVWLCHSTILYPIPGRTWDGMCYPGFLRYLDRGVWLCHSTVLYPIPGRTWDGMCYLGFLRYSDRGQCHSTVLGTYLGWHVLPGILKILGQGSMAVPQYCNCIPSRDVLGMACATRDS